METGKSFPANVDKTSQETPDKKPTLRFTLTLSESTDDKNPAFSFTELTRTAKGEAIPLEKGPWDDNYEDDKLKQLAKKFEEKYGPKAHSKKKIRDRIEDLIDVGYGYDETDPFVDNSEAYDELISADWTTEHGGFYINQGALHFKRVKEDEDSSDHEFKVPKKKKGPKKLKDPNLKLKKVKDSGEKKRKLDKESKEKKPKRIRLSSDGKEKEKKHKKKHGLNVKPQLSVTKPLSTPLSTTSGSSSTTVVTSSLSSPTNTSTAITESMPGTPNGQTDSALSSSPDESLVKQVLKTEPLITHSDDSSRNAIMTNAVSADGSLSAVSGSNQNGVQNDSNSNVAAQGTAVPPVPKLPAGLSSSLENCVRQLKEAAEGCLDGKCKFFTRDVNNLLLEIETSARELSCRVRSGIYEYLAVYLPCSKETIQKRAKKLLLTDQNGRLREPMAKLKAAVDRIMPEQEKRFQEEVQKHVEEQSKNSANKSDEERKDLLDQKELFQSAMAIDDDAEITTPTDTNAPASVQDKAKNTAPKRKFIWNGELRKLLCDVVQMKLKLYEMAKTRTQSAEDYIKEFFEAEVRPLWPKGWMTTRILYRESRQAHHEITNLPAKVKKATQATKKSANKPGETSESQESAGEENKAEQKLVNPVNNAMETSSLSMAATQNPAGSVPSSVSDAKMPSSVTSHPQTPPRIAIVSTATSSVLQRPVVTTASVTQMESTSVVRTDTKPSAVTQVVTRPFVTLMPAGAVSSNAVTFIKNDGKLQPTTESTKTSQEIKLVHIPKVIPEQRPVCASQPVREPVTILDFADLISSEMRQQSKLSSESNTTKPLQHLPPVSKTPSSSPSKSYTSLVYTPKTSVQTNSSLISPPRTQTISTTQQPVAQIVKTASQPTYSKEPALTNEKLFAVLARNNLVNLQATSVGSSGATGSTGAVTGPSSVQETMPSPQPRPADVGVLKTSPGHAALPVAAMNMSLNTTTPSSVMHPTVGVPSIPMFGHMDLQGKIPNTISQLSRAPPLGHPAMIHLARQQQEQHGIILPQNVFSQVLVGLSQQQPSTNSVTTSTASLPLNHSPGLLLTNPSLLQDPNHTNPNGPAQSNSSQFLPRFNS